MQPPIEPLNRRAASDALRRTTDILATLFVLPLAGPLMLLLAAMVRLESRGPAVFRQERAGRGGKPFTLLKLRTMRTDADPYGASPHGADDPRLTRVGRFLREWSLDELPQLWNVLRGDMTLVGPRPLYLSQAAEWNERQRTRLRVKPGLTGLAQVTGRGGLTIEEKLELDAQYVEKRSLWLDAKIVAWTIFTFLRRRDIYEKRYSRDEETRGSK